MPRSPRPGKAGPSYVKISATLEEDVLRKIRQRTENVSGFLNDAAKDKIYFERLGEFADQLRAQGVKRDEILYRNLIAWVDEVRERRARRARRAAR